MQSFGHWRVSRLMRATVVILQTCFLVACSTAIQKKLGAVDAPDATTSTVRNADFSARNPTSAADQLPDRQAQDPSRPLLFPGAEPDSPPQRSRDPDYGVRTASLEPLTVRGDDVELNFEGADIASAAKSVLGDVLHLNFAVDPKVQGTVTLASVGPIARKDLLPTFESVLRMQNAAIVRDGKFIKIVPLPEAPGHGAVSVGAGEPGFGVSVVPLKYISATTVAKTAENMLARQGAIHVDPARNLLLIQGTTSEREAALDLVSTFDVEWLRNQSVGVYPLKSTSPETMIGELQRVFDNREGGAGHDVVSFQPISRMNAVMVVAKNPSLLRQTTEWVERLDRSDNTGTTLRSYRLKYGNATQIAKILTNIFGSNHSGGTSDTPGSQIAPGTNPAQSRLDSLKSSAQGVNAGGVTNGTTAGGTTSQPSGGSFGTGSSAGAPISASFQSFSSRKNDAGTPGGGDAFGGGGDASASKGMFQNVRITADTVNNAIVVYANQEDHRIIERAVNDFDRPRLQVAIEATVAEVTLTKDLTYGVQYFLAGNQSGGGIGAGFLGAAAQTAAQALAPQVAPGVNLLLGPQNSPRLILNALNQITSVKVLSSPSIVALDNEPALLEVGNEIPISTGSATILSNSNTPVVNTIQMQNTGVILKVLPHVNGNGTIELEVDQEISAVVNPQQQTLTPTISDRHVHSTVAVASGQTVLLGGLISDNDQRTKNGIPVLGDIQFLGDLLGNINNSSTRTEIIIFIRPRVIRHSVDARAVTEEFRDKLSTMKNGANSVVSGADVKR
jgi:general secretion pathway protein D